MNIKRITLNGKPIETSSHTLKDIIIELNINSRYLAIAVNNEVVPASEHDKAVIRNDDHIEIIQPVSGG